MERDIPQTSLQAYHKPQNKDNRLTNKERIREFFLQHQERSYTIRQVSRMVGLTYTATQKRISDLKHEGFLEMSGKVEENDNYCGTFKMVSGQQKLFESRPKTRFELLKETIRENFPRDLYRKAVREFDNRWKAQKAG